MRSPYYSELNRLVNEYRDLITRAESLHKKYESAPNHDLLVEESRCYKEAANICTRLAQLYSHKEQDRNEWLRNQAYVERQMRMLLGLATGKTTKQESRSYAPGQKPDAEDTAQRSAAAASAGAAAQEEADPVDGISDAVVKSWLKPAPAHGFKDVAGMKQLIDQLKACVEDVAASKINEYLGMDLVHSFFLYGPPGCGKTYVTEAFVHELAEMGYQYMSLSSADIQNALWGEAEKRVERAFREAEKNAPCILFIDEIDSVCRNRSMPNIPTHVMSTTTAFLTGYNRLVKSHKPVIFIGATNYPSMVDSAMLDRVELIKVPLPDFDVRTFTFQKKLGKLIQNEPGFTYEDMADETDNYSQRDFDRLFDRFKREIKKELAAIYGGDGEAMVEALKSGEYRLTRELFDKVLRSYNPSKKAEIIRSLDAWDSDLQMQLEN